MVRSISAHLFWKGFRFVARRTEKLLRLKSFRPDPLQKKPPPTGWLVNLFLAVVNLFFVARRDKGLNTSHLNSHHPSGTLRCSLLLPGVSP
jgi:hypothetical protein